MNERVVEIPLREEPVAKTGSLWEVESRIAEIIDEMHDLIPPGDHATLTDENVAAFTKLEAELASLLTREGKKIDNIGGLLARYDVMVEECKAERDRLAVRANSIEKKRERLAGYVLDVMEHWDVKRLEGTTRALVRVQNPERVEIDPRVKIEELPKAFQRVTVLVKPKPDEIEKALALRSQFAVVTTTIEPDKVALKKHITEVEREMERDLGTKDGTTFEMREIDEQLPSGVRLAPGTWSLRLR